MHTEPIQILPNANAIQRPTRFGHVLAIVPFAGGLIVGGCLSAVMILTSPYFISVVLWPLFLTLAICITAAVAMVLLLLIGTFSSSPRVAQPWPTCVLIGIVVPVLGTLGALVGQIVHALTSPPTGVDVIAGCLMLAYLAVLGIGPAFALVWRTRTLPSPKVQRQQMRSIWNSATVIAVLLLIAVSGGNWLARHLFDNECQSLAAWVADNHPAPGEYKDLKLPASFNALSGDGKVNAVVTADDRVIVLLKTQLSFHYNWTGVIYATGPIAPGEIGPDGWGRTMISIKGLPYHFISKQRDTQHFDVGSDVD